MPRCRRCSPRWPAGCSWRGWGRPRSCIWKWCSGRRRSIRWPGSGAARWRGCRCRGGCSPWRQRPAHFSCAACAPALSYRPLATTLSPRAPPASRPAPSCSPTKYLPPFAARAPGLPPRPMVLLEYMLAALIGLFAGVVMAASINSMPTRIFNSTMIYDVVLVVVLGGIGLSGGRGGVFNVVIGTLLIGTMLNGMTIMDLSYSVQNIIKGVLLLVAILIDSMLNPRNEETAQQGDI